MHAEQDTPISAAVARIMASQYQPKVGDRVRVTGAIGECQLEPIAGSYFAQRGHVGHDDREDGRTGVVSGVEAPDDFLSQQGQPYEVRFDLSYRLEPGHFAGWGQYAATELERVEP